MATTHLPLSRSARSLLQTIDTNFGSLVFNARYLERLGAKRYHLDVSALDTPVTFLLRGLSTYSSAFNADHLRCMQMRNLISYGIIDTYAPLVDIEGSYTAQFEHVSRSQMNGKIPS